MSEPGRLDRIEAIVESNARAIQALANSLKDFKDEWQKDRNRLYEVLARVASAQAGFYEVQADYYRRLEEMDERQANIVDILNRLTPKNQ
ncbi:MAG: hypothetical protein ACRDEA_10660 [Microcystaceae cyanobacterium]